MKSFRDTATMAQIEPTFVGIPQSLAPFLFPLEPGERFVSSVETAGLRTLPLGRPFLRRGNGVGLSGQKS
jgi:hypothetical protein